MSVGICYPHPLLVDSMRATTKAAIFYRSFTVMVGLRQSLPIIRIPEQFHIATMRHDVIDHGSGIEPAAVILEPINCNWMGAEVCFARLLPPISISTLCSRRTLHDRWSRSAFRYTARTRSSTLDQSRTSSTCAWPFRHVYAAPVACGIACASVSSSLTTFVTVLTLVALVM